MQNNFSIMFAENATSAYKSRTSSKSSSNDFMNIFNQSRTKMEASADKEPYASAAKWEKKEIGISSKAPVTRKDDRRVEKEDKKDDKDKTAKKAPVNDELLAYLSQATGIDMKDIQSMLDGDKEMEQALDKIMALLSEAGPMNLTAQGVNGETGNSDVLNKLKDILSQVASKASDNNAEAVQKIADLLSENTDITREELAALLSGLQGGDQQENGNVFTENLKNTEKLLNVLEQSTQISAQDKQELLQKLNVYVKNLSVEMVKSGADNGEAAEFLKNLQQQLSAATEKNPDASGDVNAVLDPKAGAEDNKTLREKSEAPVSREAQFNQDAEAESAEIQAVAESGSDTGSQNTGEDAQSQDFSEGKILKVSDLQAGKVDHQAPFQQVYANTAAANNNAAIPAEVLKKAMPQPTVNNQEVFKQVIDAAKVTITEDKSEMVMQLRPENLGKLTMKIVTERGLMMAQFTAESQQVKQIIEANLPQLKDALESQGLNVQGFSVSVGQEDAPKQQYERNNGPRAKRAAEINGNTVVASAGYEEGYTTPNPYKYSDSSVDFQV